MNQNIYAVLKYVALAVGVVIIGALVGWFFVLRSQTQTTLSNDSSRGFGSTAPSGSENGSAFSNGISAQPTTPVTSAEPPKPVAQLWHVDTTPVAGFEFTSSDAHGVYFAERATGHLFLADMETGQSRRLTNTLRPKTHEALFARDGSVILRNINENTGVLESFAGTMGTSSGSQPASLLGNMLENNIVSISLNPNARSLFYLLRDAGNTIGILSSWGSKSTKRIFTSNIGSWRPILLSDGRVFVSLLAEDAVPGYAYEIRKDGSLSPVQRNIPGLSILPQASSTALLFSSSGSDIALFLQASSSANAVALPLKTIAEKCAWAPFPVKSKTSTSTPNIAYCAVPGPAKEGHFLENWYRGILHTSDVIWKINAETGDTQMIYSPESDGEAIDATKLATDPTGNYLGLINNADSSFWMLRIQKK